jgi:prepilin-type N-terminal cleavage/methylation domain-containing protein
MQRQKGFTLVEAAIAIGVVAILSGIIIPLVIKNTRDARMARARNDLQVIAGAIASQLKDTGTRPRAGGGPGGATGAGNAFWFSGGQIPAVTGAALGAGDALPGAVGAQTFENLFCSRTTDALANVLFGFNVALWPGGVGSMEFGYKGPYLAADAANRSDPWGSTYMIVGYNEDNQRNSGPIWVVCAGPSRAIERVNLHRGAVAPGALQNPYPATWNQAGDSFGNIAIRVN